MAGVDLPICLGQWSGWIVRMDANRMVVVVFNKYIYGKRVSLLYKLRRGREMSFGIGYYFGLFSQWW